MWEKKKIRICSCYMILLVMQIQAKSKDPKPLDEHEKNHKSSNLGAASQHLCNYTTPMVRSCLVSENTRWNGHKAEEEELAMKDKKKRMKGKSLHATRNAASLTIWLEMVKSVIEYMHMILEILSFSSLIFIISVLCIYIPKTKCKWKTMNEVLEAECISVTNNQRQIDTWGIYSASFQYFGGANEVAKFPT